MEDCQFFRLACGPNYCKVSQEALARVRAKAFPFLVHSKVSGRRSKEGPRAISVYVQCMGQQWRGEQGSCDLPTPRAGAICVLAVTLNSRQPRIMAGCLISATVHHEARPPSGGARFVEHSVAALVTCQDVEIALRSGIVRGPALQDDVSGKGRKRW